MPIRLLLANDHVMMRQALRQILESDVEFECVAECTSGIEAVEAARLEKPDVAIIDVRMKEMDGFEATAQILKHSPRTAVVMLSMYRDERYVRRAAKVGARGYVLKSSALEELVQAIREVQEGRTFYSPAVADLA